MVDDSDLYIDGSDEGKSNGRDFILTTYLHAGQPYSYRTNYFDSEDGLTYTVLLTLENDNDATLGDVDGDSKITVADTTIIQRYLANHITLTDAQMTAADTDKNGVITIIDATRIQRYIAKYITEF